MTLRRKLLLVLLCTAVLPMLAVRAVQAVSIFRLQATVSENVRDRLTREAEQDMLRTVDGYAKSVEQEANLIFALLRIQAGEVEKRLAGPAPTGVVRVPTAREFARLAREDPDELEVVASERHAVVNDEGRFEPLAISYATQVVLPAQGTRLEAQARADIARMSDMTGVYRQVHEQARDAILWQYTSLESGLHFSYPGKAGFPPGYTPQQRGWYRQAIKSERPVATPPFVDVSTRQLVITFAQAVHNPAGEPVGVTAIDLPVSRLLDPLAINSDWAAQAQVVVIAPYPTQPEDDRGYALVPDTGMPEDVYVIADPNQQRIGRRRLSKTQTIAFDHAQDREAVLRDMLEGKDGVRRVLIDGEDRMIAYGRIDNRNNERSVFALITAPTRIIHQPAEDAVLGINNDLRDSLVTTGGILVALLLVVGIVALLLSYRLTRPIVKLAGASRRVAEGDFETQVSMDRRDELGQLGKAFNEMVPALRDRIKIRQSLAVAMQVQQSLLPQQPPKVPGLDLAGHSEYCDETGGDYYDFIAVDKLGPDTVAIAVGDVTGHGIAAALLMATGRALIRSHANTAGPLGEVFTAVNQQLCDSEFTGRFMTLMYLVIRSGGEDEATTARFLSAGHDPIIVYRPDEDRFFELAGRDIPLGIDPQWAYNEYQSDELRQGDILVLGTDGIWECFNDKGEQFGKDRLRETIRQSSSKDAQSISFAISKACRYWRGMRDQNDDITMVVVKLV